MISKLKLTAKFLLQNLMEECITFNHAASWENMRAQKVNIQMHVSRLYYESVEAMEVVSFYRDDVE